MKKGFTLIELLAVIVILAIIAVIAVPIVLNIINDSKESSILRSAEFYLDVLDSSLATAILKNKNINDGTYNIMSDGNICLDNAGCQDVLYVEVNGTIPTGGEITIQNGQIEYVKLIINDTTIKKDQGGQLIHLKYEIGQEVIFDPGDANKTWNVIGEDATTVTLMLTENLGNPVDWYRSRTVGPVNALNYLNDLTLEWDNVDPITNYSYVNNLNGNGYQKIEIEDGKTTLIDNYGTIVTDVTGISKARMLSLEELLEIASKTNENIKEENLRAFIERNLSIFNEQAGTSFTTVDEVLEVIFNTVSDPYDQSNYAKAYFVVCSMVYNGVEPTYDISIPTYLYQNLNLDEEPYGYWLLTTATGRNNVAWIVSGSGLPNYVHYDSAGFGVRPVITIQKSKLQ